MDNGRGRSAIEQLSALLVSARRYQSSPGAEADVFGLALPVTQIEDPSGV